MSKIPSVILHQVRQPSLRILHQNKSYIPFGLSGSGDSNLTSNLPLLWRCEKRSMRSLYGTRDLFLAMNGYTWKINWGFPGSISRRAFSSVWHSCMRSSWSHLSCSLVQSQTIFTMWRFRVIPDKIEVMKENIVEGSLNTISSCRK